MPDLNPLFDEPLSEMNIAVFDIETSGLYPSSHRIIQIATVSVSALQIGAEYDSLVNPGEEHLPLEDIIVNLTGISTDDLREAPDITTVLQKFQSNVGTNVVAGHNVEGFDLPFIRRAEQRTGIEVQSDYYIDTLKLAYRLQENGPRTLADCARYYGLEVDDDALHNALVDTHLCGQLLVEQIKDLKSQEVNTFGEMIRFLS